jgi:hypothetical protein
MHGTNVYRHTIFANPMVVYTWYRADHFSEYPFFGGDQILAVRDVNAGKAKRFSYLQILLPQ